VVTTEDALAYVNGLDVEMNIPTGKSL
jgi:hypothetical protein